jgi:hypothetical protein
MLPFQMFRAPAKQVPQRAAERPVKRETVESLESRSRDEQSETAIAMSGRDWWEDQRANILASNMPADEAQRELATLGPEPPDGTIYLNADGERVPQGGLQVDPMANERTETEELRHQAPPLSLVNERELPAKEPPQLGLEL